MSEKKIVPSGRKKGGAVFPRISLEEAVGYARKLVSKTHTGALPFSNIFPGVFGVNPKSSIGQVRASALKQYGLLQGKPEAYEATDLAKRIASAPDEELSVLFREAFLKPRIFRVLFDTFKDDTVSIPKLKQQASSSDVHPDMADNCAQLFVQSASFAKVGELSGDGLSLSSASTTEGAIAEIENDAEETQDERVEDQFDKEQGRIEKPDAKSAESSKPEIPPASSRSVIHVNVTIDSSLDTEKLERQLILLRKYGAI